MSEQDKIARIIDFLAEGLDSLNDEMKETTAAIDAFMESLKRAKDDLRGIKLSDSGKKKSGLFGRGRDRTDDSAKQVAASNLVSLLTGGAPATAEKAGPSLGLNLPGEAEASSDSPSAPSGLPSAPPSPGGLPSAPAPPGGLPSAPPSPGGLPSAPPSPGGLPSAPAAPPAPAAPAAPPAPAAPAAPPAPAAPAPAAPPAPGAPPSPPAAGGAPTFTSLRDEMLNELNRLKSIMKGT